MPFDPARLIARKDALGLTAQQVEQLSALEGRERPAMAKAIKDIRARREAIDAALSAGAPDTILLRQNYEALQNAAGTAHWARISTSLQARAILTDAQRGKVRGWAAPRGGRWHSKGHGYRL
jgi:Spy/CpxP family protein refolding chaperone